MFCLLFLHSWLRGRTKEEAPLNFNAMFARDKREEETSQLEQWTELIFLSQSMFQESSSNSYHSHRIFNVLTAPFPFMQTLLVGLSGHA